MFIIITCLVLLGLINYSKNEKTAIQSYCGKSSIESGDINSNCKDTTSSLKNGTTTQDSPGSCTESSCTVYIQNIDE